MKTTREEWTSARPVFLLVLKWSGRYFYASTEPIQVDEYSFTGGLSEDPDINFQMPELGFSVSSYSTPISVYLNNVDISKQASNYNYLDNAEAELSYILVKPDGTKTTFDNRIVLINGIVKQPVFGHLDQKSNYVEFSIENESVESSMLQLLVGSSAVIDSLELSSKINTALSPLNSLFVGSTTQLEILDIHKGKNLTFVIGQSGFFFDEFGTKQYFGSTPAYVIYALHGGTNKMWLAIAGHDVDCTSVRIYDDLGNFRTENVQKFIRRDGRVFCFVEFTHSSGSFQNPVDDESARFFVSWMNGGGFKSPISNAPLSKAGELCLYMLSLSNQRVNMKEWIAVKSRLNAYSFAGYINEFDLTPLEFLENEIVPFLPISIIQSEEGLKPVFDVLASGASLLAIDSIVASPEFKLDNPVQTLSDTSQIINDYTLQYVYDAKENEHKKTIRISGETKDYYENVTTNQMSIDSFQRFGSRPIKSASNFIHDDNTAALVVFDKIQMFSSLTKVVSYRCSARFGYLNIGDIIELTDDDSSFENRLVQVISKSWEDTNWSITFKVAPEGKQI